MAEGLRERSTVHVRAVLIGAGGILASVLIALLVARGLMSWFGKPPPEIRGTPFTQTAGPPLEVTPRQDLQRYRASERPKLERYRLVNEKDGVVQIPIDRAMAVLADEHSKGTNVTPAQKIVRDVGVDQHPGQRLPLNATFRDESGASVPLASYFGTRPVVLTMVYYGCPNLCSLTLTNLLHSLEHVDLTAGRDFDVLAVSIDPRENSQLAAAKRLSYTQQYGRGRAGCNGCEDGWHFLTGPASQSEALAHAVGIRYAYDAAQNQYAHPAAALVVTPKGRIARYFNGIEFPSRELRWALLEAKAERTGGLADSFWLLCYHYEALVGRYSGIVQISVRLLAVATVLVLGFFIFRLARVP